MSSRFTRVYNQTPPKPGGPPARHRPSSGKARQSLHIRNNGHALLIGKACRLRAVPSAQSIACDSAGPDEQRRPGMERPSRPRPQEMVLCPESATPSLGIRPEQQRAIQLTSLANYYDCLALRWQSPEARSAWTDAYASQMASQCWELAHELYREALVARAADLSGGS